MSHRTTSAARSLAAHGTRASRPAAMLPALLLAVVLTACGGDGEAEDPVASPSASASQTTEQEETGEPTEEPTEPAGTVVDMTLEGGAVTPNGERIEAAVGEPVTMRIQADAAGELHVHSTPEHSFDFEPGESEFTFTVDSPGVVEVELHDPALVVVQLEVR